MVERDLIDPRILKGFRDIDPPSMRRRNYITEKLIHVFEIYGFQPLETPTIEYLDVLTGKMGEDTDKQIFAFKDSGGREVGLRYELTVSLARYIAMNPNIKMPFKRYQIEKVFRAEKPQKGRFREFTQCDVDIIGSDEIYADTEIISILAEGMERLGLNDYEILINDRELLSDIFITSGVAPENINQVSRIIDKMDKAGVDDVLSELDEAGLLNEGLKGFLSDFSETSPFEDIIKNLLKYISSVDSITRINGLFERLKFTKPGGHFVFLPTLARGLDYYTGVVFEVVIPQLKIGSVGGGGRYDNLIGSFLGRRVPAVGTSFGLDRLEIAMQELDRFPGDIEESGVLVTVFGEETLDESLSFLGRLREGGIISDIYPSTKNIGKQLGYADTRGFSFTVIIGPEEMEKGEVKIKDMKSGDEVLKSREKALEYLRDIYKVNG